jgi:glycosyltransferase involved in cell wall biosynthesis
VTENDPPKLLYVLHQYDHLGGAELQTRILAERLRERYAVRVAWMDLQQRRMIVRDLNSNTDISFPAEPVTQSPGFTEPTTERAFGRILKDWRPDVVHFQHMLYWPLSAIEQALATSRVVMSFYDYLAITPDYAMLGVRDPLEIFQPAYSMARYGMDVSSQLIARREKIRGILSRVHARVVISDYLGRVLRRVYDFPMQTIEPGIEPFDAPKPRERDGIIRFGYLGSFISAKGMEPLTRAFVQVRGKHANAELHTFGGPVPRGMPPAGQTNHGPYAPTDLPGVLATIDIGVIPSIFAETFSIVLSEYWHANRPVIASHIGAIADRIVDGVNGFKVPPGDIPALANAMNQMIESDDWRNWQFPRPRMAEHLVADHHALYQSLLRG